MDLEHALSALTAAMTVAEAGGESAQLTLSGVTLNANELSQTRRVLNHALAWTAICLKPNSSKMKTPNVTRCGPTGASSESS